MRSIRITGSRPGPTRHVSLLVISLFLPAGTFCLAAPPRDGRPVERPNIVWLTCEDISPNLGCYGDPDAVTPNLDQFAANSVRYTLAFAPAGVCAPARSTLITGMYASSIGSHHMRSTATLSNKIRPFTTYLRHAGYFCTNQSKQDYNFKTPADAWDIGRGPKAHWRSRKPGQPFFAVFNHTDTHESRIRGPTSAKVQLSAAEKHQPEKIHLPPYLPDTRLIRQDWARYLDLITMMDKAWIPRLLGQLKEDGLDDNTIIFFFSDHGVGLPRSKQFVYDSGMQVPLLIYFPPKWRHLAPAAPGSNVDRLVSFVDFGPTVLSLAGVPIPPHMQGRAFLGTQATAARQYVFGIRDRMDERYDMTRTVRDNHFKYHRHYMPYLPHFPWLDYMEKLNTAKELRRLKAAGKLQGAHAFFMADTKPIEELYDIQSDPFELHNLAGNPVYRTDLERLRQVHQQWVVETVDTGLLPEQTLRDRAADTSEYDYARSGSYDVRRIAETAWLVDQHERGREQLTQRLHDPDAAVRFWAANGLANLGVAARPAQAALQDRLDDANPEVRVAAAQALCRAGMVDRGLPVLMQLVGAKSPWVRLAAANAIDNLGAAARPAIPLMRRAMADKSRENMYIRWIFGHTLKLLADTAPTIPVGAAKVDITPDGPIRLCGYASRQTESEGVAERIWAKALVIGSDADGPCVILTTELIGTPASLVEPLARRLEQAVHLPRSHLVVCATHTHTGPCLSGAVPYIFGAPLPAEQQARVDAYTRQLAQRLEQVVRQALDDRKPSHLAWGQGQVDFAVNRRALRNGRWIGMRPNPSGPVDHQLPILVATTPQGDLRAVLINYACHCTTYGGGFNKIHGDWAGVAARLVEQNHDGAIAMVAAGCGGDANPQPRGANRGTQMVQRHGQAVADEVERLLATHLQPLAGPPECRLRHIQLPLDHVPDRAELQARLKGPKRTAYYARVLLHRLERGEPLPSSFDYPVQTWRFGTDLTMVFLAGEVVVDYALRLKSELGAQKTWVTAYANAAPCYIASARLIREGGYEVDESMNSYDKPTRLATEAEDLIVRTVHQLVRAPAAKPSRPKAVNGYK